MTTNLQLQTEQSVQSAVREERSLGVGLLFNMVRAGEIISPWWSQQRDRQLVEFLYSSDHVQGAFWMIAAKIVNVPYRVMPRDRGVKRHQKMADQYQAILDNMIQFGQGWLDHWFRFFIDLWSTDNGAFSEVLGAGDPDGPIEGPATGLAHLDSLQCWRTSSPEYPVQYQDTDGKIYRFHHTRVIHAAQLPSGRANMNGMGHCWLSRCLNNAQRLVDKDVYFQEMMGSRPLRQILLGRGISSDEMVHSVRRSEEGMDNRGLRRYAKTVFVGDPDRTDIGIDSIPFSHLPDSFNEDEMTRIAMATIALSGGFPLRWIWPAGGVTGATKADALYQHIAGQGGGVQWHLNLMRNLLSYSDRALSVSSTLPPKFLPKELRLEFDFQDDEQDRQQAEIRAKRADTRKTGIENGVIDIRAAREQALDAGDITMAQFNRMELGDGRLPNGDDVLTLYDTSDEILLEVLDLGVDEPLLVDANDPLDMIIEIETAALDAQARLARAGSQAGQDKMRQALAALGKLKGLYEQIVGKQIEEEIAAQQQAGEFTPTPAEEAEAPAGEPAQEEKARRLRQRLYERAVDDAADILASVADDLDESDCKELVDLFLQNLVYNVKGFDFGARVGERIRGGLFRGRGGKFASEGEISGIKSEILGRLIARLRAKRQAGTGRGRAKKPKKPKGGGGKQKPDKAKIARENRAKVFDGIARKFDIEREDLNALAAFVNGETPAREALIRLAQNGLAEFDSFGNPRTTSAGKALFRAASADKVQAAEEAISRGREAVLKVRERAEKKREKAAELRERAEGMSERVDELNAEADELEDKADAEDDPEKAEKLRERAERKREQADKARTRQTRDRERADEMDADADGLEARVGGEAAQRVPERPGVERPVAERVRAGERPPERESPAPQRPLDREAPTQPPDRGERPGRKVEPMQAERRQATQEDFDVLNRAMSDIGSMTDEDRERLVASGLMEMRDGQLKLTQAGITALKQIEIKSVSDFRLSVRAAIRGLWSGQTTQADFVFQMVATIERRLTEAWNEGAALCGIKPDELTDDETIARMQFINGQFPHLPSFASDIDVGSKANGGKLQPFLDRGELWIGRYEEARQRGQAMACANRKLEWVLGEAAHCQSCLKLSGKVKRARFWSERGIIPQVANADYLECRGFNCDCQLLPTDKPVSRGPLPKLP